MIYKFSWCLKIAQTRIYSEIGKIPWNDHKRTEKIVFEENTENVAVKIGLKNWKQSIWRIFLP